MSEQSHAEKTEEPTAKRRGEFLDRGTIAKSQDIAGVAILSGMVVLIMLHGQTIYAVLDANLRETLAMVGEPAARHVTQATMAKALGLGAGAFVSALTSVFAVAIILGVVAGVAQTGGNIAGKAFEIKWSKFNPVTGLTKQLITWAKLQEVGLALLKAVSIGTIFFVVLRGQVGELLTLAAFPLLSGLAQIGSLVLRLLIAAILVSAALAVVDYFLSFRRIHEEMKMTKQEVKDERKQAEGDPTVKNRRRQKMLQIGYNRMLAATADADVVVVNPTHYAVALAYRPERDAAPKLLAKGKDAVAFRIRQVAREHQIPVISNPPVARAVYHTAKVGAEIPAELYEIVARVLAYMYRMTRRAPA
ncbi:MAG: EscU/YscU/HrcU family type III secretion system export apparatus switch protein [Myxococcales bacterium FL481]|nr:MAG: EscU/YscU/HrcU family type III secretion system export apparatus switch protein [Myxococcales bacterium FL481]